MAFSGKKKQVLFTAAALLLSAAILWNFCSLFIKIDPGDRLRAGLGGAFGLSGGEIRRKL